MTQRSFSHLFLVLAAPVLLAAAENRVLDRVDLNRRAVVAGNRHPAARGANDRGLADPALQLTNVTLLLRPSASLEGFLREQQDPASPNYHKWLTPEQFGDRFGLSQADLDQVTGWLRSQGLQVHEVARGRHWVTFSGTTEGVGRALGTQFHRYRVNGEDHVANTSDPTIPAALAGVVGGFDGLHDFAPRPQHVIAQPLNNSGSGNHYLAPDDFATIYNVKPLYDSGLDGTGVAIGVIGQTAIDLTDIQSFRRTYHLPANDPKLVLVGTDPGKIAADMVEADLDLEWSGAVARNATIYYIYSRSVRTSLQYAIDQNVAPILTYSYGACEFGSSTALRYLAQQANAQGITVLAASGDQGAAVCDAFYEFTPQAAKGTSLSYPANVPEVTAVGGTQFNEGASVYWNKTNDANGASVQGYVPEAVWNESDSRSDLVASTGGASAYYAKPAWQAGPGVPDDHARDVPDLSLNAGARHVPYLVVNSGALAGVGGTSAGSPAFAGVVALLTQYLQQQGAIAQPGLGNINPTLYRLAQSSSGVFHDVVDGDNKVWCVQSSANCVDGELGYAAGPGYDLATGLGTIDANNLVTNWATGTASTTSVVASPGSGDLTTNITMTAIVSGGGKTPPTGTVTFTAADNNFGTVPLVPTLGGMSATITAPAGQLAATDGKVYAVYSGDGTYAPSTGMATVGLSLPGSGSFVVASITPNPVPQAGSSWPYSITLTEKAGVATKLTGFTVNGVDNGSSISSFMNGAVPANGNIPAGGSIWLTNLAGNTVSVPRTPFDRTFVFTGQDAGGTTWSRSVTVTFTGPIGPPMQPSIALTSTPSTSQQNLSASPSCQWAHDLVIEERSGYAMVLNTFLIGNTDMSSQMQPLFGATRLAPYGALRTTICWDGSTIAPSTKNYTISASAGNGAIVTASARVNMETSVAGAAALSVAPQSLRLTAADNQHDATAAIDIGFSGAAPQWKAYVTPTNAATAWLQLSPFGGTGAGTIGVQAATKGLSNGVYRASIAIETPGATPDHFSIPVTLVVGPSDNKVGGIANAASFAQAFAPGMLLAVFVEGLTGDGGQAATIPLPLALGGISATVNGISTPIWGVYPSAGQINLQVPYEAGSGPAVLAIHNGGKVSEYNFNLANTAPGLFGIWDPQGRPVTSAAAGQTLVAYITGEGELSTFLPTGNSPAPGTATRSLPKARQPLSVTIGGVPATVLFNGIPSGLVGVTQVNFTVPAATAAGPQPVVITVGDASTQPVTLNIAAQ